MLWVDDELADHGLNDTYISIERAAEEATEECHPKVYGKAYDKEGGNGTDAPHY